MGNFPAGWVVLGIQGRIIWECCTVRGSSASFLPLGMVGQLGKPGILPGAAAWPWKGFLDLWNAQVGWDGEKQGFGRE